MFLWIGLLFVSLFLSSFSPPHFLSDTVQVRMFHWVDHGVKEILLYASFNNWKPVPLKKMYDDSWDLEDEEIPDGIHLFYYKIDGVR